MTTTLTLNVDAQLVKAAQEYAAARRRDLSALVENYLRDLVETPTPKHSPLVEELTGVIDAEKLRKLAETDERARYILRGEY